MIAEQVLERILKSMITDGDLTVEHYNGKRQIFGNGKAPHVTVRFQDSKALGDLLKDPEMALGELYMNSRLVIVQGTLMDLLQVTLQGGPIDRHKLSGRVSTALKRIARFLGGTNSILKSRENVAHHYDLSSRLYDLFLDSDRQYSCAYFETPDATLEEAQLAKKRHIAAKLFVEPGQSVLDIGCGWGGLGLYLAEVAGAGAVRGITLSDEQLLIAKDRAASKGLDHVQFVHEDYRHTQGKFDRIVSVGMFEHVGKKHYDEYFRQAAELLSDDGVMLMHTIGHTDIPDYTNPWITKYIFPGGHLPSLSEVLPSIEKAGLMTTDVEILRLHYAETLRHWRERFMAHRDQALELYDERFCLMWEFYLAVSEAAFRYQHVVIFQFQLTKKVDTLPVTRNYIHEREDYLRDQENRVYGRANTLHLWAAQ